MDNDAKVCNPIGNDLGVWKKDLILDCFALDEAKKTLSIPLSHFPNDHKVIWHHEKNGEFSFKFAYHASMAHKDVLKPVPSSSSNQKLWQLI